VKPLYKTSIVDSLIESLASGNEKLLKELLRKMLGTLRHDFVTILEEIFRVSDEKNRKILCRCLSELGLHLDLWSKDVNYLYHLISKNCQKIYLADFKVMLNHNALMKKRFIDANFYERYGIDIVFIFETLLNSNMSINNEFYERLINNIPEKVLNQISKLTHYIHNSYVLTKREIIYICELLIKKLDIMGIIKDSDLSAYLLDKINMLYKPLDYLKATVLTFVLMHLPTKKIDSLFRALIRIASNVSSLLGISTGIALSIIHVLDFSILIRNQVNRSLVWMFLEKIMTNSSEDFIELIDLTRKKLVNKLLSKICINLARITLNYVNDPAIENQIIDCIYAVGINYPFDVIMILQDLTNRKINQELLYRILRIIRILIIKHPELQSKFALIISNLAFNADLKNVKSITLKKVIQKNLAALLRLSKSLAFTESLIYLIKYFIMADLDTSPRSAGLLTSLTDINEPSDDLVKSIISYLESD